MKCKKGLEVKVLRSMAGYYVGTTDAEGPYCRLSEEYFKSQKIAEQALADRTFTARNAVEIVFCSGGSCEIK